MLRWRATTVVVILVAAGAACARRHHPATPSGDLAATAPSADGGTFDRPDLGVRLDWPPGWVKQPSQDFVLLLGRQGADESSTISLDVPSLPPHIPGMIPIGSVRGGYLDDLRKSAGPLKTTDLSPPPVPGASQRFVRSTWSDAQGDWQETALLMVHADRVYILRAKSRTSDEQPTRAAFDAVAGSLKWTK